MKNYPKRKKNKINSNKSFGIIFFIVFLVIGLWPLINSADIKIWSILLSLIFLILGAINSKILTPLNRAWFKIGLALGSIISPIIMGLVFFIVLTPTGLIMKLFRKDLLMKKNSKDSSYWIERDKDIETMKRQF